MGEWIRSSPVAEKRSVSTTGSGSGSGTEDAAGSVLLTALSDGSSPPVGMVPTGRKRSRSPMHATTAPAVSSVPTQCFPERRRGVECFAMLNLLQHRGYPKTAVPHLQGKNQIEAIRSPILYSPGSFFARYTAALMAPLAKMLRE